MPGAASHNVTGRTARDVDLLELPAGEERERSAVGRPKRRRAPVRADESLGFQRVKRTDPDERHSRRIASDEGHLPTVWRDSRGPTAGRPCNCLARLRPLAVNTKQGE